MTSPESQNSNPVTEAEKMDNEIKNTQNTGKPEKTKTPETPKKTGITFVSLLLEDFRHRRWMLVLSSIAQFFCGPFFTLFVLSRYEPRYNSNLSYLELKKQILDSAETLCGYLTVLALIVAAVGALIVGFGGFRHLFNKRMTDMMNSVPVKRGKTFAVIYLNGLLMWVVPFLFFGGISFIEIAIKLGKYGVMSMVFGHFLMTLVGAAFAFFCIYNLIVLCTTISGTIFNAIVNSVCLGFEASAFYLIIYYLSRAYFQNFWNSAIDYLDISWISAPISGCAFGFLIGAGSETAIEIFASPLRIICFILTAAVCIVNFIIGYRIYVTRKSEEAENGTSGNVYKFVLRFVSSILAGLYTSFMVNQIAGDSGNYGWCIFIAACFSALAFGVMDIIQKKSFRAFFAHRGQMILSVAATLIILAVFIFDVINFDNHIVPESNIASASVRMRVNNYYWGDYGNGFKPVEGMPGYITWDEESYNENSGEVEISADLAEKIMRAEKVYFREYDPDYGTSAYSYDPVTGVESSLPLDEWSMYYDYAFVYFDVDRNMGLDFLRSYRISDEDLLEDISKTEGYKELNYPLNCGLLGYPESVRITDDYGNAVCTLKDDEAEKLMKVYFDEFNKNFDLYGVNYMDQRYYAVQIQCSYEMIYNEYSSGSHYFYIVVGEKDTATVRMIERLTGMPVDTFMDDEDLYYYG
ncbi:MAG: hypothetical protein J5570_05760 [Lachnospiraceae bacterium]|nr:hypothetical protein [Lachnospiraceae bacterium]